MQGCRMNFRRLPKRMSADSYSIVAQIINKLEDAGVLKQIADFFATEFNRRSRSFDPSLWNRLTGGKPAPDSASNN
jgi:hypothetical protein